MENVPLVNMNIAGTPTATPVTPKKTKPTKCKKKVVKPDGLGIFRQKMEEVDESTHTLSTRDATLFEACRCVETWRQGFVLRICDDSRCTHGFVVLVAWQLWRCLSTGSSAASARRCGLGAASSHLQRVSFAIPPVRGWLVPGNHHVSITLSSNGPHQTRQMKFIVACLVHVWCGHEIASPSSN